MKKNMRLINNTVGLSLLELMIGLAIVSILLTAVGPNVQSILTSNRITSDVNTLSSVMRFARHTAVNEQTTVTLCATTNFTACTADWNTSKMVFIDANGNGQRDNAEELLASGDPTSKTNTVSGVNAALTFNPDGSTQSAQTIVVCPDSGDAEFARALLVSLFGRISISVDSPSDADNIAENAAGTNLSC